MKNSTCWGLKPPARLLVPCFKETSIKNWIFSLQLDFFGCNKVALVWTVAVTNYYCMPCDCKNKIDSPMPMEPAVSWWAICVCVLVYTHLVAIYLCTLQIHLVIYLFIYVFIYLFLCPIYWSGTCGIFDGCQYIAVWCGGIFGVSVGWGWSVEKTSLWY